MNENSCHFAAFTKADSAPQFYSNPSTASTSTTMIEESLIAINSATSEPPGCWSRFRRSKGLVVWVNIFSMITGIMVVSVLQPILPDLLDDMYRKNYLQSADAAVTESPSSTMEYIDTSTLGQGPNNATFPQKAFIIGSLLGFAPLVEIFFTPVAVIAINCFGLKVPMIAACLLQLFGCYAIAYANVLPLLYAARITQAVSVIFATVAGFSMIAIRFKDDDERSQALATTMNGFPIGILIAYPCGTAIYSYFGLSMPFIIISGFSIVGTVSTLLIKETDSDREFQKEKQTTSYIKLLTNKAIMLSLMLILYSWFVVFLLGATTPNRMSTLFHAESWQIGIVLFVSTVAQIIASAIVGKLAGRVNRWLVTLIGNLVCVIGLAVYPWCTDIYQTMGPETVVRIGWGMVISSMSPLLGTLVDRSHGSSYIRVYALFMSFNLFGAFSGSLLGGWLDGIIGFTLLYWSCAVMTLVVAVLGFGLSYCLPKMSDEELEDTIDDMMSEWQPILETPSPRPSRHRHFSTSYQIGVA